MQFTLTGSQVHISFALPAWLFALLVTDLPLCPLVTEHLDLAVSTVNRLVASVVVAVCVNLQVQRETLHTLLRGKVCAQAVDWDEDLNKMEKKRSIKKTPPAVEFTMGYLEHTSKPPNVMHPIIYSVINASYIVIYFQCYIQDAVMCMLH